MAFNGSGTFERLYNWVADKAADIKITASRMDGEMDGFATGLTNCITKDGQTQPTADLPMSSQKHTTVANADARDQYAAVGQVQDSSFIYAADASNTDTYVLSPAPAITAYAAGQTFIAKITNANTGATTLNVSTVGAKNVYDREGNALVGGEIPAGSICTFVYDGTQFQLMSTDASASATVSGRVELATNAEADTGTDTERAITPAALAYVLDGTGGTNQVETAAIADNAITTGKLATAVQPRILLATGSTGGADVTFDGDLSGYDTYEVEIDFLEFQTTTSGNRAFGIQVGVGATYRSTSYASTALTTGSYPSVSTYIPGTPNHAGTTNQILSGLIRVHRVMSDENTLIQFQISRTIGSSITDFTVGTGWYNSAETNTSIRLFMDVGSTPVVASNSIVRLYGVSS